MSRPAAVSREQSRHVSTNVAVPGTAAFMIESLKRTKYTAKHTPFGPLRLPTTFSFKDILITCFVHLGGAKEGFMFAARSTLKQHIGVILLPLFAIGSLLPAAATPLRVPQPMATAACPAQIDFGETIQCAIDTQQETDQYTFTANKNDQIKVRLVRTSGRLNPALYVAGSEGDKICSAFTSDTTIDLGSCTAPSDDTFTIFVEDTYRANTGSYNLYIQRLNDPGKTQPIRYGQTLAGSISMLGQTDTYTFTAAAGDQVKIRMTRTSDTLRPRIRVYDQTGTNICTAFSSAAVAEIGSCSLVDAGAYAMLVDDTGTRLGNYNLSLDRLGTPPTPLANVTYLPLATQGRH